jgi:mono/diheme cytochrome c family protein
MFMLPMFGAHSRLRTGLAGVLLLSLLAACGGTTPAGPSASSATTAPVGGATSVSGAAAVTAMPEPTAGTTGESARPSNPGGPGPAATMTGDSKAGAALFATNCKACHGDQGKGGVSNPGSSDGTVPPLNPIDETLMSKDPKVFAYNLDLFIQHGSTPAGDKPALKMAAWGDDSTLTQQQIADVIAYIMSLNPAK